MKKLGEFRKMGGLGGETRHQSECCGVQTKKKDVGAKAVKRMQKIVAIKIRNAGEIFYTRKDNGLEASNLKTPWQESRRGQILRKRNQPKRRNNQKYYPTNYKKTVNLGANEAGTLSPE